MGLQKVGALHTVPRPSATVATEALNLLSALGGGDKKVRKELEEMRDVQTHNERVFKDAKAVLTEVTKAQTKLDEETAQQTRHNMQTRSELTTRTANLGAREQRLDAKVSRSERESADHVSALNERDRKLSSAFAELQTRERDCDAKSQALGVQHAELAAKLQATETLRTSLKAREARLRTALDSR